VCHDHAAPAAPRFSLPNAAQNSAWFHVRGPMIVRQAPSNKIRAATRAGARGWCIRRPPPSCSLLLRIDSCSTRQVETGTQRRYPSSSSSSSLSSFVACRSKAGSYQSVALLDRWIGSVCIIKKMDVGAIHKGFEGPRKRRVEVIQTFKRHQNIYS
jgi:hypothetical protein